MGFVRGKTGKIFLLAIPFALALAAAPAEARRSYAHLGEIRLRVSPMLSSYDYNSNSDLTGNKTAFTGQFPGGKVDGEIWLTRRYGLGLNSEYWHLSTGAHALASASASAPLFIRVDGDGNSQNSESVVFAGPAFQYLPDARSYSGANYLDTRYLKLAGAIAGLRFRAALTKDYALELGGSYTFPARLLGGYGVLVPATTHTISGMAILDYRVYEGLALGWGIYYSQIRLNYIPDGSPPPLSQQISINIPAALVSFRFWF
jgi:hypothetical protein